MCDELIIKKGSREICFSDLTDENEMYILIEDSVFKCYESFFLNKENIISAIQHLNNLLDILNIKDEN